MYTVGRVSGPVRCELKFDLWVWQGIFLPVHFQRWLSLTVMIQPPCTITLHHNKTPRVGSHTLVWTHRNAAHIRSTLKDGMWLPKRQRNRKQPHTYLVLPGYKEEYLHTYIYIHTNILYLYKVESDGLCSTEKNEKVSAADIYKFGLGSFSAALWSLDCGCGCSTRSFHFPSPPRDRRQHPCCNPKAKVLLLVTVAVGFPTHPQAL